MAREGGESDRRCIPGSIRKMVPLRVDTVEPSRSRSFEPNALPVSPRFFEKEPRLKEPRLKEPRLVSLAISP